MLSLDAENLPERMRAAVSISWLIFSRKVGGGLISINKEASMQLQFAYILQQLFPLITFHKNEAYSGPHRQDQFLRKLRRNVSCDHAK